MSVHLSARAKRDYDRAMRYSQHHFGERQAIQYSVGMNQALYALGQQPNLGRPVSQTRPALRVFLYRLHFIYYRISEDRVEVLKIIDARRDPKRHR